MSNAITFMDCWGFIAPLLPVSTDFERGVYVMVFHALMKEAEKKRIAEKKKEVKHVADVTRVTNEGRRGGGTAGSWGKQFAGGSKTGGQNDADQH